MTKKDYNLILKGIVYANNDKDAALRTATSIAFYLAQDSLRFDRNAFFKEFWRLLEAEAQATAERRDNSG